MLKTNRIDLGLLLDLLNIEVVDANGTAIPASTLYNEFVSEASKIDVLKQHGFVVKIVQSNVMVMFLVLVALVVGLLLSSVFRFVLWPLLRRTLGVVVLALWRRLKRRVLLWWARRRSKKNSAKVHVESAAHTEPPAPADDKPADEATATAAAAASGAETAADQGTAVVASLPLPLAVPLASEQPKSAAVAMLQQAQSLSARLRLTPRAPPLVLPEFTDYYRKTVPRRFQPDAKLGFERDSQGELVRVWKEETIVHGLRRVPGERMRTWEAMQAPVKSYAIEMNDKYKLAVAEIVAAAKRMRTASLHVAAATATGLDSAIAATEPIKTEPVQAPAPVSASVSVPVSVPASVAAAPSSDSAATVAVAAQQEGDSPA
ncbi:hypothetical protein P43SY_000570 [Pythium insidiosum]|uniref:Transmembrane protein n=1 Tax=Pythium insidiosum TaxID=114742 RepID=A0AAD5LV41_PYTIN|nr:hypothetical protein P43SY_000570 [Pythium insidiosum]